MKRVMEEIKMSTELCGIQPDRQPPPQIFPEHDSLSDRVQKTLYYSRMPSTDRPSLPLTQLAVDQYAGVGLKKLARLDIARAAEMSREAYAGPTSLVLALIYLDRLKKLNPEYLKTVSSADLFLISMMVASKFLHDDGEEDEVFNDEWAKSGNIDVKEFNRLEIEFLCAIDWKVNVSAPEFDSALRKIEHEIAYREMMTRGWASYSDLLVLTENPQVSRLWRLVTEASLKMTAVCMAAYAASIFTLVGTVAVLNQTPLGPTGVSEAVRSLRSAPTPTTAADTLVPEADRNVSPAELLTASLLVTSLSSSEDHNLDFSLDPEPDGQTRNTSVLGVALTVDSASPYSRYNDSLLIEDKEPPDWILEKTEFIPHATKTLNSLPTLKQEGERRSSVELLKGLSETMERQWANFPDCTNNWSRLASECPRQSQCPLRNWVALSLINQFSILV